MSRLKKTFLALLATLIFLALAEAAVRVGRPIKPWQEVDGFALQFSIGGQQAVPDSLLFWRPQPGKVIHNFGRRYIVNQDGFRGFRTGEYLPKKVDPEKTTVVCVGDSVTFGYNIENTIDTFPAQLQIILGDAYEVINLGRPGYSTSQGLQVARRYLPRWKPEILVVGFGWNDCYPSLMPDSEREPSRESGFSRSAKKILSFFRLYQLGRELVFHQSADRRVRVPLPEFREQLIKFSPMAARTIYLVLPQSPCDGNPGCISMTREKDHHRYNQVIREMASVGEVLDLEQVFAECGDPCRRGEFVAFLGAAGRPVLDPIHPNALGAKRIARILADRLANP